MKDFSLVVVTGMSGAGKSVAANVLEDLGYYTIDNLPVVFLEKFIEVIFDFNIEASKVALVIDSRSGDMKSAFKAIEFMKERYYAEVIYLDADDKELIKRFKETRRAHPMGNDLPDAISTERAALEDIRDISDIILNTNKMTVHDLKSKIETYFKDTKSVHLHITVQSFGFKHGVPEDSDLVFDVRFLKNPHFVEELREFTGLNEKVRDYVFSDERAKVFLKKLKNLLSFLIPNYINEGKRFLTVSIGCTGGKHRSVAITEFIYRYLADKTGYKTHIKHRDINR